MLLTRHGFLIQMRGFGQVETLKAYDYVSFFGNFCRANTTGRSLGIRLKWFITSCLRMVYAFCNDFGSVLSLLYELRAFSGLVYGCHRVQMRAFTFSFPGSSPYSPRDAPRPPMELGDIKIPGKDPLRWRLTLSGLLVLLALLVQFLPAIQKIEWGLYDLRAHTLSLRTDPDPDIVIIAIDEETLDRLEPAVGRWPWTRDLHALVIDFCSEAKAISLDVLLAERLVDRVAGVEEEIERIVRKQDSFVAALAVDHYTFDTNRIPRLAELALPEAIGPALKLEVDAGTVIPPYPELLAASAAIGHVNIVPDSDGTTRMYASMIHTESGLLPSLGLSLVHAYLGHPAVVADEHGVRMGSSLEIPLEAGASYRFSQTRGMHMAYRYADVIDAWRAAAAGAAHPITPDLFKDKIVIVGSVAFGLLQDTMTTPAGGNTFGVEIHASAVDSMLNRRHIRMLPVWAGLLLLILVGLSPLLIHFERAPVMLGFCLAVGLGYLALAYAALLLGRLMLPLSGPLLALLFSSVVLGTLYWYQERRRRRWLEDLEVKKQQFTDMLVHDLKNAVVPLSMAVQMAQGEKDLDFLINELPIYADRCTSQLLLQVNSILDIRKMQDGRMPLEPMPVEPVEVILGVIETYQLNARHASQDLVLERGEYVCSTLLLDPAIFRRVVENLIWNAVKYANTDSTIIVTCRNDAQGNFYFDVGNRSSLISPSDVDEIFGAFVTGPTSRDTISQIPSTGLGLAFCKLAIEAHEGSIVLKSPWPGYEDGVCVSVYIPSRSLEEVST